MPNKIQKTLQDYLSKIKHTHPPQLRLPFHTKNWVLPGCKHPRTPSFALEYRTNKSNHHHNHNNNETNDAATLADVDRFLVENFKSLYVKDSEGTTNNNNNKRVIISEKGHNDEEAPKLGSVLFESPRLVETPRDLCGSSRFFVKPGFSGSLLEDAHALAKYDESPTSTTTSLTTLNGSSNSNDHSTLPDDCIALLTYSPSPFEDFRRSMQEVVEARFKNNHERVNIDWDFMEELLFCYLNLNDKKSHKFILSAFVDLVTALRRNSDAVPMKPRSVRTVRSTSREFRKKTKQVTLDFGSS